MLSIPDTFKTRQGTAVLLLLLLVMILLVMMMVVRMLNPRWAIVCT